MPRGRSRRRRTTFRSCAGILGDSARVRGSPALADHGDLDLAGILQLLLHGGRDLVRDQGRALVVDLTRIDDHPQLAAGPHRVDALDAVVARRDLLDVPQSLYVFLE